jgi:2-polyprenyl-3-methyl-5-hydroxy-6-metoxy-1,4-benzoquinol methylase
MDFDQMYDWWEGAAKHNALNAILSSRSDWEIAEFFETGRESFAEHRGFAATTGTTLSGVSALDFGCGVGRVTNALTEHFDDVVGIDISHEMIRLATEYARSPSARFQQVSDLPFPFANQTFDLVYSSIVVQHIPAPYNIDYVREFFRVARDVVLFDAPSHLPAADRDPGAGIFLLSRDAILALASKREFELVGLRLFPATAAVHYQYVFRSRAVLR